MTTTQNFDQNSPEKKPLNEECCKKHVLVPQWQLDELARRKTKLENDPDSVLLWDDVKRRVRSRYGR